jgi:hypothetical protein
VLIAVSLLVSSQRAQEIYAQLDALGAHHRQVEANLQKLRSDVNLSGIFVRDYLLDIVRERAPEYRQQLAGFRRTNIRRWRACEVFSKPRASPFGVSRASEVKVNPDGYRVLI